MEHQPGNELFSIRLTNEGVTNIRRLGRLMHLFAVAGVLLIITLVVLHIILMNKYSLEGFGLQDTTDIWVLIEFKYFYWIAFVELSFFALYISFYFRFYKQLSKSISQANEGLFNRSFSNLFISLIAGLISYLVMIFMYSVSIRNLVTM